MSAFFLGICAIGLIVGVLAALALYAVRIEPASSVMNGCSPSVEGVYNSTPVFALPIPKQVTAFTLIQIRTSFPELDQDAKGFAPWSTTCTHG
jgi:hypothetical protein